MLNVLDIMVKKMSFRDIDHVFENICRRDSSSDVRVLFEPEANKEILLLCFYNVLKKKKKPHAVLI